MSELNGSGVEGVEDAAGAAGAATAETKAKKPRKKKGIISNILSALGGESPTNGGKQTINYSQPYTVTATIRGVSDFLFNKYDCDAVALKATAAKGSKAKKTTDPETQVYRNDQGELCVPGEYFRQSIIHASKFKQDPRSPRKSAMDMFKAGIVALSDLCSLGIKEWHYMDRRRAIVGGSAIPRERPAIKKGWEVEVQLMVNLPEYIDRDLLLAVLSDAGRLIGVGDFRPTFGRFAVVKFELD